MSAEVVAQLHPPRLPEAFTQTGVPDILLAMGLGLVLAALVFAVLAPLSRRKTRPPSLQTMVGAAEGMPAEDALLHLAKLAQARGLPLTPPERAALYASPSPQIAAGLATRLTRPRRVPFGAKRQGGRG